MMRPAWLVIILVLLTSSRADEPDLRLADGFTISLYSDADLANDIQAMTLDAHGRVVVTGPGYVKTLHDDDGDGHADRATTFATVGTGGMGLCFDGNDLLYMGDGWLSRYRDANGDGVADGPPERIAPFAYGEHGGHAIRKGPDGWWYVIGGNDAKIDTRHINLPLSPIKTPQCGAIVRFSPDFQHREVIAHGFRNPYDFDFDKDGNIFTYDSDCERDELLPWGTPTRIFQVQIGAHHGWRLTGYQRSHAIPDDMPDVVPALRPIGRGSPTGVVNYRHHAFPKHYHNGLFALDWTFGKVFFLPLGEGLTEAEVFLEPKGNGGFAPVDAVVAPDGALLIAIGGRKSRGAVYRIVSTHASKDDNQSSGRDLVLSMPMPLEAHSRKIWEKLAKELGRKPFERALVDVSEAQRVRAIEILTECFGGLPGHDQLVTETANDPAPSVRARLAWSLGRVSLGDPHGVTLHNLAIDPEPSVRLAALNALEATGLRGDLKVLRLTLQENAVQPSHSIRLATAHLLSRLTEAQWSTLKDDFAQAPLQAKLTWTLAAHWRGEVLNLAPIIEALKLPDQPSLRLQALRLAALAMGGEYFNDSPLPSEAGYVPVKPIPEGPSRDALANAVRTGFPRGIERDDFETGRVLAMLADREPSLPRLIASMWTETSLPTRDVHYLMVLTRLPGPRTSEVTQRTVEAFENLDRKLAGRQLRLKQSWMSQLEWIFTHLKESDSNLDLALVKDKRFPQPSTMSMVANFGKEAQLIGLREILERAKADPDFPWTSGLIQTITQGLPRQAWLTFMTELVGREPGLTDPLIEYCQFPLDSGSRPLFLQGLQSASRTVVEKSITALTEAPRDLTAEGLLSVLAALKRVDGDPKRAGERAKLLKLLAYESGQPLDMPDDPQTYARALAWFATTYPGRLPAASLNLREMQAKLARVDWPAGDSVRGESVFKAKTCQVCHSGARAYGPDLAGVAGRLSRADLFDAILAPHRDVAPAYQTTVVATRDGTVLEGMVVFESGDGLMLQTGATTMVRLAAEDIESRKLGDRSLMPEGLLDGATNKELADIYAYLRAIEPKPK